MATLRLSVSVHPLTKPAIMAAACLVWVVGPFCTEAFLHRAVAWMGDKVARYGVKVAAA